MAIMNDGYSTTISFSEDSDVQMEEKEVTPPGLSGGGEIDTTTMRNTTYRTKAAKSLIDLTESSISVAYDGALYDEIIAMINTNQEITITFPDSATLVFWGYLNEFNPGSHVEGEQPTADITIIPTNENDSGTETGPVYTSA